MRLPRTMFRPTGAAIAGLAFVARLAAAEAAPAAASADHWPGYRRPPGEAALW